jgi:hypothetical protein
MLGQVLIEPPSPDAEVRKSQIQACVAVERFGSELGKTRVYTKRIKVYKVK